ncbi:MAG: type I-E CRISPR-associated protein Cas7/Cse4/CasC [Hyphomicrobiaceae bacterium]
MTQFFQLHVLTPYAASNLNRDDAGRPKTLNFGGAERLRVSSQSLKRAFRTSDVFNEAIGEARGTRSNSFTESLVQALRKAGVSDDDQITKLVSAVITKEKLGALKKENNRLTEQLVHLGPEELARLEALAQRLVRGTDITADKETLVLVQKPRAADIALFGRMLADNPLYNIEAAAQVAHAFTTHRVSVEDDFYTAVDDLKSANAEADRGAGFIGVGEYGAGVFYLYVNVDTGQLLRNLAGDKALAANALEGFIEAALTVSPKGKQNSYASRTYASYALAELGSRAPRSLAGAFVRPVGVSSHRDESDYLAASITRLGTLRRNFDSVYGPCATTTAHLNTVIEDGDAGNLASIKALAKEAINGLSS